MVCRLGPSRIQRTGLIRGKLTGGRRDPAVWCAKPGGEQVRSQAVRAGWFWEREPGMEWVMKDSRRSFEPGNST